MRLLLAAATTAAVSLGSFWPFGPFLQYLRAHEDQGVVDLLVAVPEDAVLLVATDELDAIRQRGKDNAWVRFFRDEEFSPLWAMIPFDEVFAEEGDEEPWFHPLDVLASIHGRVACFMAPAGEEGLVGGGVLVRPGRPNEAFLEFWDRAVLELEESEHEIISMREYGGVELMLAEDPEDEEDPSTGILFEVEGLFAMVVSDSTDAALDLAYGVIDRTAGDDPSLGFQANVAYQGTRKPGKISPAIEVLVVLQDLLALADEPIGDSEDEEVLVDLGLDAIEWIHLDADIGSGERLDLLLRVHMPSGTLLGDFADFFGPLPLDHLKLMPAESLSISLGNYDVWGAYQRFCDYMSESHPEEYEEMLSALDEASGMVGGDIEQDLLAQLRGTFSGYEMKLPEEEVFGALPFAPDEPSAALAAGGAFIVGLREKQPVEGFLNGLLEMIGMGPMVETEDFQGYAVNELAMGFLNIQWAFIDQGIVISMFPTAMRSVLRLVGQTDVPTAADNEQFTEVLGDLRGSSMVSLSDTKASMEAMLEAMAMITDMVADPMFAPGFEDPDEVTLADLQFPAPELAAEYFQGTMIFSLFRKGDVLGLHLGSR